MENEESGTGTGMPEDDDNVVQLPRDWLGPREDLVPFGPRARPEEDREALAPDDFWGENSQSLHGVVQGAPAAAIDESHAAPTAVASLRPRRPAVLLLGAVALLGLITGLGSAVLGGGHARAGMGAAQPPVRLLAGLRGTDGTVSTAIGRLAVERAESSAPPRPRPVRPRHAVAHPAAGVTAVSAPPAPTPSPATFASSAPVSSSASTPVSSPQPTPTNAGSAAASGASASGGQPAFDANGTLGPGSSPNG